MPERFLRCRARPLRSRRNTDFTNAAARSLEPHGKGVKPRLGLAGEGTGNATERTFVSQQLFVRRASRLGATIRVSMRRLACEWDARSGTNLRIFGAIASQGCNLLQQLRRATGSDGLQRGRNRYVCLVTDGDWQFILLRDRIF